MIQISAINEQRSGIAYVPVECGILVKVNLQSVAFCSLPARNSDLAESGGQIRIEKSKGKGNV